MARPPTGLQVEETGDRMVFFVHSEADPRRVYRVDLLAHGGRGECMCKHWRTRCWPLIRDGASIADPFTACKHVTAARRHFLLQLLPKMAAQETASP